MPQNSKCSPEEKAKAVEDYLNGKKTSKQILQECGIDAVTLRQWVCLYKASGIDGLTPKGSNKCYPPELKMQAVNDCLAGQLSLTEILLKYKISDKKVVKRWIKKYNSHGEFKSRKSGSEIYMAKGRETSFEERQEIVSYCLSHGSGYRAVMEQYGVSYQQIYNWMKRYRQSGIDGLQDRRGKPKLENNITETDRLRAENRMLKAQLYDQQMENDVIKKLIEVKGRWS